MIVSLKHEIQIAASPKTVFSFFENLEQNYTRWHPDHIGFHWVSGNTIEKGTTVCFIHRINGKVHELPAKFTDLSLGHLIEYVWRTSKGNFSAPKNLWRFIDSNGGCLFISESELLFESVSSLSAQLETALTEVRKHLAEEGENLKILVETEGIK
jgi:uncharacterized protein YndB with AHSA1/START domain